MSSPLSTADAQRNASPIARHRALEALWRDPTGWGSVAAVNHSTIGRRFILTALIFFLVGGVLAMLIRAQLATSGAGFLDSETYNQIFTMHGTLMMFLFAIPMLEGFAMYLLPKMLGARDLAYPRLGAYAYWCYLCGGLILLGGMALGLAPSSGWFMYTPLSGAQYSPGINADIWLIGITFAEISAICAGVELITSILTLRAPGMRLDRMPLFAWYVLVTAGMILIGFPPLILGSILLELERAFGLPFFEVARGGDPLLWQHLFWMFGHPEVYIIFLPAAGMVSTMIPTFARHPMVGYRWIVASIVLLAVASFGLWVHHMFTVGIPHLAQSFFSIASMLVAIPTGVQFFAWIATLWMGKPVWRLPMLYLAGFLFVFVAGGLTGVMLALVPFNWQVHDTHFVVAHMHYVLTGGLLFPLFAAVYYWMPHMTGRMPSERLGTWSFWLIFGGFNVAFLPMHLTGLLGMPRRVFAYPEGLGWDTINMVSSIGSFVMAMGVALFILDVFVHARIGRLSSRNPWGASTLEWAMPNPAPSYNFAALPAVDDRDPLWRTPGLGGDLAGGRGALANWTPGVRETLAVDIVDGEPTHVVRLPGPSFMPFAAAMATAAFFLCVLFKVYAGAIVGAVVALALFIVWAWRTGADDRTRITPEQSDTLLPHTHVSGTPGVWGVGLALTANGTLFAALLFGYVFLWLIAPNWPPATFIDVSPVWFAGAAVAAVLAWFGAGRALRAERRGRIATREQGVLVCGVGGLVLAGCMAAILAGAPPAREHAYAATTSVLLGYIILHAAVGLVFSAVSWRRGRSTQHVVLTGTDLRLALIWWRYVAVTALIVVAVVAGLPHVEPLR
ncbi:cytochrome c oxidase subunit I [Schauerella aestuarii]|uniref:cytochrome c oxidase subunit I n=1 Tax=Schauerella aestuarii TaxID=2511204 RepID=UPI00136D9AF7|nr:cytochrome c oxidase subunit I [Achromobacter aestuarii]MYZ45375.1 cytochrome c oxidase subunit I [Achromobacter aestuarii]